MTLVPPTAPNPTPTAPAAPLSPPQRARDPDLHRRVAGALHMLLGLVGALFLWMALQAVQGWAPQVPWPQEDGTLRTLVPMPTGGAQVLPVAHHATGTPQAQSGWTWQWHGDPFSWMNQAIALTTQLLKALAWTLMAACAASTVAGLAALLGHRWARLPLLAISVLQLLNVPFGTAVAFYTFWAYLRTAPTDGR